MTYQPTSTNQQTTGNCVGGTGNGWTRQWQGAAWVHWQSKCRDAALSALATCSRMRCGNAVRAATATSELISQPASRPNHQRQPAAATWAALATHLPVNHPTDQPTINTTYQPTNQPNQHWHTAAARCVDKLRRQAGQTACHGAAWQGLDEPAGTASNAAIV